MSIIVYPFPELPGETAYRVFPYDLEEDDLVFFHATHIENLQPILSDGFEIPDPNYVNGLGSVSFAKKSDLSLHHAVCDRQRKPGEYCIIVVRYATLDRNGLAVHASDMHDTTLIPPPEIIGYTVIPESYLHR